MAKDDKKAESKNKIVDEVVVDDVVIEEEIEEVESDEVVDLTDDDDGSDNDNEDDFTVNLETGSLPDPDLDDQEGDTSTITTMRKKLREAAKQKKEADAREVEYKAKLEANVEKELPTLGAEPELENYDYDEPAYKEALRDYDKRKAQHDAKKADVEKTEEDARTSYENRFNAYQTEKVRMDVPDYDKAEKSFRDTMTDTQAGIVIDAASNPALLILALSQNPKQMKALADERNPSRFAVKMALMEDKMNKGLAKNKPSPERRIAGGNTERGAVGDKKLNQLRAKAAKSGDYTEVSAYRRQMKAAS